VVPERSSSIFFASNSFFGFSQGKIAKGDHGVGGDGDIVGESLATAAALSRAKSPG